MEEKLTFEESLKKLQEIVDKLESGEVKLDEAFASFEKGLEYVKNCQDKLKDIETKVLKIVDEKGNEKDLDIGE